MFSTLKTSIQKIALASKSLSAKLARKNLASRFVLLSSGTDFFPKAILTKISSGVQDYLNDLVDTMEKRKKEEEERKKREEEEAARKKFEGTRVTVESFLKWKEKFDAELESLKSAEQKKREAELKGRMTGERGKFSDQQ